jgi:hypothetical protein
LIFHAFALFLVAGVHSNSPASVHFVGLSVGRKLRLTVKRPTKDQQMSLSDVKIRNAKPGSAMVKHSDGGGLQLCVTPAGGKIWKLAYRFDDKQKALTLGPYPAISLQDARERREEAKRTLASGDDPSTAKRQKKRQRAENATATFGIFAAELLDKKRREGNTAERKRQVQRRRYRAGACASGRRCHPPGLCERRALAGTRDDGAMVGGSRREPSFSSTRNNTTHMCNTHRLVPVISTVLSLVTVSVLMGWLGIG